MISVQEKFELAIKHVQNTPSSGSVSQDFQLQMYGLFKQANEGDVKGKAPGLLNPVARAKFKAWEKNKGMSQAEAMEAYVKSVEEVLGELTE